MKVWDASSNTSPRVLATAPLGIFMNTTCPLKTIGACVFNLYILFGSQFEICHIAVKHQWWTLNRLKCLFIKINVHKNLSFKIIYSIDLLINHLKRFLWNAVREGVRKFFIRSAWLDGGEVTLAWINLWKLWPIFII